MSAINTFLAEVEVVFNPDEYEFMGGQGMVSLTLEVVSPGSVDLDVEVTINLVDTALASMLFAFCFKNVMASVKIIHFMHAAFGDDFKATDPLTTTILRGSSFRSTAVANLTILDDQLLEGQHCFRAEVANTDLVVSGVVAMICINDNDSELYSIFF